MIDDSRTAHRDGDRGLGEDILDSELWEWFRFTLRQAGKDRMNMVPRVLKFDGAGEGQH
jgi:hypothetical protein